MRPLYQTSAVFKISTLDGLNVLDLSQGCSITLPLEIEIDSNVITVKTDNAEFKHGTKNDPLVVHTYDQNVRHWHANLVMTSAVMAEFNYFFRHAFRNDSLKLVISKCDIFADGLNNYKYGTLEEDDSLNPIKGQFVDYEVKLTRMERPKRINNLEWQVKATFVKIGVL